MEFFFQFSQRCYLILKLWEIEGLLPTLKSSGAVLCVVLCKCVCFPSLATLDPLFGFPFKRFQSDVVGASVVENARSGCCMHRTSRLKVLSRGCGCCASDDQDFHGECSSCVSSCLARVAVVTSKSSSCASLGGSRFWPLSCIHQMWLRAYEMITLKKVHVREIIFVGTLFQIHRNIGQYPGSKSGLLSLLQRKPYSYQRQ